MLLYQMLFIQTLYMLIRSDGTGRETIKTGKSIL